MNIIIKACYTVLILIGLACPLPCSAETNTPVIHIGILAHKGKDKCISEWSHTMAELQEKIPAYKFELVPCNHAEIKNRAKNEELDFVLVSPAIYADLEYNYGFHRIATLIMNKGALASSEYHGAVFCLASNTTMQTLRDVKGHTIAAIERTGFGGYVMQARELRQIGIHIEHDAKAISFLGTQNAVIRAVLSGQVDAGFVRADSIENMIMEGEIRRETLRILPQPQSESKQVKHSYPVSTRAYPEWPMAAGHNISRDLAKQVAIALFTMPSDSKAMITAGATGWMTPENYQEVHNCLRELGLPPYENYGRITLSAAIHKLSPFIFALITLILLWELIRRLRAQKLLTKLVALRTGELSDAYKSLQNEMANRILAEDKNLKMAELMSKTSENRLKCLLRIAQHPATNIQEFLDFALNEAIELTASKLGYIYHYNEVRKEFILNTWSKNVMKECSINAPETVYQLDKTGVWGEAVRQRKPIVINDFAAPDPHKKGYPEGHVALNRFLTIPVMNDGRIVAVVGVANKLTDYVQDDIDQLTLLMDGVWKITDRKRAENALQTKTAELDQFFNIALDLLCIADSDGHFRMLNRAWERTLGFTREELMAKKFMEFVHPCDIEATLATMKTLASQKEVIGFTNRYQCKDSTYRWIEWRAAPAGKLIYAAARDITERKRTEMELQKLALVVQNSSELINLSDVNGKMIFINDAGSRMVGIMQNETEQHIADDIIAPACRARVKADIIPEIMRTGNWKGDLQYCHIRTGKVIDVHAMIFLINDPVTGDPLYLATVALDISERKRMEASLRESKEAAEAANNAKSVFLANISHEIRTPLNAIIGFGELLSAMKLDEKQRTYVDPIKTAGRSLLRLLNDLLDLSKIEAGRMELQVAPVDLRLLIEELGMIFAPRISQKGIKFVTTIDPEIPTDLLLDEIRVRQVLVNIIGNALKFTEHGSVRVTASKTFTNTQRSRLDLQIAVEDTGIGIPEDEQEHIFGAFHQQSEQSALKYGGTGLGLTISRRLLELMNGTVTLKSIHGKGSTFTVIIPDVSITTKSSTSGGIIRDEKHDLPLLKFSGQRVLIVDDTESNLVMLRAVLENCGLNVIEARDGQAAVNLANETRPDLVIMDIRMPGMSGFQATALLKKKEETRSIPVIALTASTHKIDSPAVVQAGFARYLVKPLATSALLREIDRVIGGGARQDGSGADPAASNALPSEIIDIASIPDNVRTELLNEAESLMNGIVVSRIHALIQKMTATAKQQDIPGLAGIAQKLSQSAERLDITLIKQVLLQICRQLSNKE